MILPDLGVLYVGPTIAGLLDTSSLGVQIGVTDLGSWWEYIEAERGSVSPYGAARSYPAPGGLTPPKETTLIVLIVGDTPAARITNLDTFIRLLKSGGDRTVFRVGDDARVAYGRFAGALPVPTQEANWEHGDSLVSIRIVFDDPYKYAQAVTTVNLVADIPTEVFLGASPSFPYFVIPGPHINPEFYVYDDDSGVPGSQYGNMTLVVNTASGDDVEVDHDHYEIIQAPALGARVFNADLLQPGNGWYFMLGQGRGEVSVWVESSEVCVLTYFQRW